MTTRMMYYVLNDSGQAVAEDDLRKWGEWMERTDRRVERTEVKPGVEVSTVFLGVDHSFGGAAPVLWETLVFGGPHDGEMERYTSVAAARAGHAEMVALVKGKRGCPRCGCRVVVE